MGNELTEKKTTKKFKERRGKKKPIKKNTEPIEHRLVLSQKSVEDVIWDIKSYMRVHCRKMDYSTQMEFEDYMCRSASVFSLIDRTNEFLIKEGITRFKFTY